MARASRRKFHYIYRITNKLNGKFYIGMHSTDNLDDGYFGSGKRLGYSIKKYGRENHELEILEHYFSREDLSAREKELVNQELLFDERCLNLSLGGDGGGSIWSKEHAEVFHSAGGKACHEKYGNGSELYKRRVENRNKTYYENGGKSPAEIYWAGRKMSNEHKRKIGEKNSNSQAGSKNSQFGTCWIHNGVGVKKIKKEELQFWLDKGWCKGRKLEWAS